MKKIVLIGLGGHAHSVIDSIIQKNEYEIVGYVDNEEHNNYLDIKYLGNDDKLETIYKSGIESLAMCIGYMGGQDNRKKLYDNCKRIGFKFPIIIDKTAIVANNAEIGEGTFIGKSAVINANSKIGKMCIINSKALIEHDCEVGDFTHIAVSTCICGNVIIGQNSFVGANTTIVQSTKIGENNYIGAGMLVYKDMESNNRITVNSKLYEK